MRKLGKFSINFLNKKNIKITKEILENFRTNIKYDDMKKINHNNDLLFEDTNYLNNIYNIKTSDFKNFEEDKKKIDDLILGIKSRKENIVDEKIKNDKKIKEFKKKKKEILEKQKKIDQQKKEILEKQKIINNKISKNQDILKKITEEKENNVKILEDIQNQTKELKEKKLEKEKKLHEEIKKLKEQQNNLEKEQKNLEIKKQEETTKKINNIKEQLKKKNTEIQNMEEEKKTLDKNYNLLKKELLNEKKKFQEEKLKSIYNDTIRYIDYIENIINGKNNNIYSLNFIGTKLNENLKELGLDNIQVTKSKNTVSDMINKITPEIPSDTKFSIQKGGGFIKEMMDYFNPKEYISIDISNIVSGLFNLVTDLFLNYQKNIYKKLNNLFGDVYKIFSDNIKIVEIQNNIKKNIEKLTTQMDKKEKDIKIKEISKIKETSENLKKNLIEIPLPKNYIKDVKMVINNIEDELTEKKKEKKESYTKKTIKILSTIGVISMMPSILLVPTVLNVSYYIYKVIIQPIVKIIVDNILKPFILKAREFLEKSWEISKKTAIAAKNISVDAATKTAEATKNAIDFFNNYGSYLPIIFKSLIVIFSVAMIGQIIKAIMNPVATFIYLVSFGTIEQKGGTIKQKSGGNEMNKNKKLLNQTMIEINNNLDDYAVPTYQKNIITNLIYNFLNIFIKKIEKKVELTKELSQKQLEEIKIIKINFEKIKKKYKKINESNKKNIEKWNKFKLVNKKLLYAFERYINFEINGYNINVKRENTLDNKIKILDDSLKFRKINKGKFLNIKKKYNDIKNLIEDELNKNIINEKEFKEKMKKIKLITLSTLKLVEILEYYK